MALPKWLQDTGRPVVVHQKESAKMLSKAPVKVKGHEEDLALFVGSARGQIIMQETLDREGVGRTRMFDANAKGGKSKKPFSEAERKAAKIARIE